MPDNPDVLDREAVLRALRRRPDIEAPNLYAVDATDRLLLDTADDLAAAGDGLRRGPIAVIGDRYGALTLGAAVAFPDATIGTHQDPITGVHALAANAADLGLTDRYRQGAVEDVADGARLVLMQLPRGRAELTELVTAAAHGMHPDGVLLAGGRVKHMAMMMTDVLAGSFRDVTAGLARQKSRVLTARGPEPDVAVVGPRIGRVAELNLDVVAYGPVFSGATVDHGTAALLGRLDAMLGPDVHTAVDLGCGTGILAVALAARGLSVIATDRSDAAIRSAAATAGRAGVAIEVLHDDAAASIPDGSVDLVVCNPPFHEHTAVHVGGALKLFAAAGRILRPGGQLWTVHNTHLGYLRALRDAVGPTESIAHTGRYTVTRSVRAARD
ncbi:class I SAM-dependent methyltransferase [Millisia brevis]|uniref:class I SAM-dependent methyltransferase n=1 Tax=Millisia brevis TaxID=264148 RepID=UPI000AA8F72F|nr:methyltransferase [Millisia brevis]